MSTVAEHTVVVYNRDAYRFSELRSHYEEYVYIQCLQTDLISLGIIGFFVKTIEEDFGDPIQIYNNPNVMTGSPLGMIH
jgi:hypothetical protein